MGRRRASPLSLRVAPRSPAPAPTAARPVKIITQRIQLATLAPGQPAIRCRKSLILAQAPSLAMAHVVMAPGIGMQVLPPDGHWRRWANPQRDRLRCGRSHASHKQACGEAESLHHGGTPGCASKRPPHSNFISLGKAAALAFRHTLCSNLTGSRTAHRKYQSQLCGCRVALSDFRQSRASGCRRICHRCGFSNADHRPTGLPRRTASSVFRAGCGVARVTHERAGDLRLAGLLFKVGRR